MPNTAKLWASFLNVTDEHGQRGSPLYAKQWSLLSSIQSLEGVSGWTQAASQSMSSVPQQLRDQLMSLTGHRATECWPVRWAQPRASDQWRCLACGLFFMAVLLSSWLSAVHTAALQMDAGTAEATGLKIPSSNSSRPVHWEDEARQRSRGHRPNLPTPPSRSHLMYPSFLPLFLHPFFPPSSYKAKLHGQPARIWSVALGVCGPRLLNKGTDWLIDRPSAVPAHNMFPSYPNPLLARPTLAFVKRSVWWIAPIFLLKPRWAAQAPFPLPRFVPR